MIALNEINVQGGLASKINVQGELASKTNNRTASKHTGRILVQFK